MRMKTRSWNEKRQPARGAALGRQKPGAHVAANLGGSETEELGDFRGGVALHETQSTPCGPPPCASGRLCPAPSWPACARALPRRTRTRPSSRPPQPWRKWRGRGLRLRLLGQARLQGLHQIDDLAPAGLRGHDGDVLPFDLLLDQAEDSLLDVILVGLGLEGIHGALIDEELGEVELLRADLGRLERHLGKGPDLVGIEQLLHDDAALEGTEHDEVHLAAGGIAGQGDPLGLLHDLREKGVRLGSALVGPDVVRPIEVDGVHLRDRNELDDLDGLGRLLLERLELLGSEGDVAVLRELEALDHLVAGHDLAVLGADVLLLQPGAVLRVEHVEGHARRTRPRRRTA